VTPPAFRTPGFVDPQHRQPRTEAAGAVPALAVGFCLAVVVGVLLRDRT
jgi:hypothetical protein